MLSLKDHKHPFDLCIGSQTTPLVRGVQCFTPKRGHWSFPLPLAFVQLRIVSSTCGRRNYSPEEYRSNETGSSDGVVHISHSRLTRDPQRSPACAGGDRHRVRTITMRFFFSGDSCVNLIRVLRIDDLVAPIWGSGVLLVILFYCVYMYIYVFFLSKRMSIGIVFKIKLNREWVKIWNYGFNGSNHIFNK